MEKEKLPWRSFADARSSADSVLGGPICNQWDIRVTPTLYLLDSRGVIRYRWIGRPAEKTLDEALEKLIKEAEQGAK